MHRLDQLDLPIAARITELRPIVSFRNRIIYGYDTVDDAVVWGVVETHLPCLVAEVADLLAEDASA